MTRGGGIVKVVDEILSADPNAGGLAIHYQFFGSNGQEKADYSRGVLERFTRRAPKNWYMPPNKKNPNFLGNCWIKNIVNPRKINFFGCPHAMKYFEGFYTVDENLKPAIVATPFPIVAEKIVLNHYHCKSWEEYNSKRERGDVVYIKGTNYNRKQFDENDRNEEFDDGILKYRDERAKIYQPPDKSHANERLLTALMTNLLPTLKPAPQDFYAGKMETFLTCRAVASYLKTKLADNEPAKFFEEASLVAILRSLGGMTFADARILIRELPNLLGLPYPAAKDLRSAALNIISQLMNTMRLNGMWKDCAELDYIQDLIKLGG